MSKRVYIAGPMRGRPHWNWPAFDAMAERLRALGFDVVNPADLDRERGIKAPEDGAPPPQEVFDAAMARDLTELEGCDAIYLMEGWQESEGTKIERRRAMNLGLELLREVDIERMGRKAQERDATIVVSHNQKDFEATLNRKAGEFTPTRTTATGAHRDTRTGKGRYDLLPPEALHAWARRLEDGASKYGDRNWEKGMNLSWFLDSGMRHLTQLLAGDESEDHAAAVLFNIGSFIAGRERISRGDWPEELDDTRRLE